MLYFEGYERPNGTAGIRNQVLILSTSGLSNPLARRLALLTSGTVPVAVPNGRGQIAEDYDLLHQTLIGLAANANIAGTLVVGYDSQTTSQYQHEISTYGKPTASVSIADEHGVLNAQSTALSHLVQMVVDASSIRRTKVSIDKLTVALECGGSDPTSGKVSNPTVGFVSDEIVKYGGSSIFSETVELIGTEKILQRRAKDQRVANEIETTIASKLERAKEKGYDVRTVNPVPENIAGGLDTLEEKALGAVMKTGNETVEGVLNPAERPSSPGLYFMDTPFFSTESMTAMVAGGAQLVLFTTGVGNNIASSIAPTLKVTGNTNTPALMSEHIDCQLDPSKDLDFRGEQLMDEVIEYCSGKLTKSEVIDETDSAIIRIDESV